MTTTIDHAATKAALDLLAERLDRLEEFQNQINTLAYTVGRDYAHLYIAVDALKEQVAQLDSERKTAEHDEYVDLRRALLVIGLTEIVREAQTLVPGNPDNRTTIPDGSMIQQEA
jgi:hypothetical protein